MIPRVFLSTIAITIALSGQCGGLAQERMTLADSFHQLDVAKVFDEAAPLVADENANSPDRSIPLPSANLSSDMNSRSFQTAEFDPAAGRRLSNNFTSQPLFADGITIMGRDVAMKIGGYVKADLITDLDSIDSKDAFDTGTIPTSGPSHRNVRFHARQTRFSFDTRWRVDERIARAYVESDFFGGESDGNSILRLRHAYGTLGNFTAGQTWTTFTDPSAVPQTLDFEGAVSNVNRRQALVRWDQPILTDGLSLAFAIEDPRIVIIAPPLIPGEGRTESPDFVTRLRMERDWGSVQSAFLLRELGFQPDNRPVISDMAWGFNFTGAVFLSPKTKGYYQVTFGEGIGSYRGSPDVVATGLTTAEILPMFGWMAGVHHQWTERLTSNFTFSQLTLDNIAGQDPGNLRSTNYLAANLIANPYERVFCGIEFLYGTREDISGASGSDQRIQMSFGFYLP